MTDRVYVTSQRQRIDQVCHEFYGYSDGGIVDRVLDLNQNLVSLGPLLPIGTRVRLPAVQTRLREYKIIQLWD